VQQENTAGQDEWGGDTQKKIKQAWASAIKTEGKKNKRRVKESKQKKRNEERRRTPPKQYGGSRQGTANGTNGFGTKKFLCNSRALG